MVTTDDPFYLVVAVLAVGLLALMVVGMWEINSPPRRFRRRICTIGAVTILGMIAVAALVS